MALEVVDKLRRLYPDSRPAADVAAMVGGWLRLGFSKLYPLVEVSEKMRRACANATMTIDII